MKANITYKFLYTFFLCVSFQILFAQTEQDSIHYIDYNEQMIEADVVSRVNYWYLGLGLISPAKGFDRYFPSQYFRIEAGYARQLFPNRPTFLGVELGYSRFQSFEAETEKIVDGVILIFNSTTGTNLLSLDFMARHYLGLNVKGVEFFGEARLGINYFYTITSASNQDDNQSQTTWESNNFGLRYGVGGGMTYPLNDNIFLGAKAAFIGGLSTHYYSIDDTRTVNNSTFDVFEKRKTSIDHWLFTISFTNIF